MERNKETHFCPKPFVYQSPERMDEPNKMLAAGKYMGGANPLAPVKFGRHFYCAIKLCRLKWCNRR